MRNNNQYLINLQNRINFNGFKNLPLEKADVLLRSMDDLVFVLDANKNFTNCFQPASPDLAFSTELFIGKHLSAVPFPSEIVVLMNAALNDAESSGLSQMINYKLVIDEKEKWFNAKISLIKNEDACNSFIVVVREITEWKENLLKLELSEKKYHLLADNTTDLVVLYNPDGTIFYISPSVYKLLGYHPESLSGIDPSPYIHPDDLAYIHEHFKPELFPNDTVFSGEYRLLHANGNWIYFSTNRKFLRDAHGEITHILACCRDITEKVQSEEALRKSETHHRMLADNILDLIGLHDLKGVFEYVSPSSLTVLGYTSEELVGINAFDLVHPDDSAKLFESNSNKAAQGIDTFMDEFRILHKNGHYIYFETTTKIIRDKDHRPLKFLSTSRDITEWKQAQCALKESEERYRSLVESSDNMIAMVDCNNNYLFVNSAAARMIGTTPENIIGKNLGEITNSESTQSFITNIQAAIKEERAVRKEETLFINGGEYWLRMSFTPIRNSEGKIYAVLINAIDITNLKNTESLLEEQNKGLREIAFLQSHIIRSPLANIKHLISLLNKETLSEENKIVINLLEVSAENLDNAVQQIVEKTYLDKKS